MASERYVAVEGLRTRVIEHGAGAPVVLLHGASLGSSADVWERNLADFAAQGLHAIAPDLPGFGRTDPPGDPSLGFRTRFVPRLLDVLGIERAHLVGHSQSGRIVVTLGTKQAERVVRAVVAGTASLLPPLPGAAKDSGEGDEGTASEPTLEDARRLLEGQLFDRTLATPQAVALRHAMSTGRNFAAFLARRAAKGGEKPKDEKAAWQRVADVRVPLRLVYGREDRAAAARGELARTHDPALDMHLVPRAGHLVQWDAPREFAALVAAWLAA